MTAKHDEMKAMVAEKFGSFENQFECEIGRNEWANGKHDGFDD